MKKVIIIFIIITSIFVFIGCKNPYIGRKLYDHPDIIHPITLGEKCYFSDDNFSFNICISHVDGNEYRMVGEASLIDKMTFQSIKTQNFRLFLVDGFEIVDAVTLFTAVTDLSKPLTFKRTFKTEELFNAIVFDYYIQVIG